MKKTLFLAAILIVHTLFIIYTQKSLYPIHFIPQSIFVLDMIGKPTFLPSLLLPLFGMGNLILLWFIGKCFFKNNYSFLPSLIYAVSPWGAYLAATGSYYIYLLFLILLIFYSLLSLKSENKRIATVLLVISVLVTVYSSILLMLLVPAILILMIVLKLIPLNNLRFSFISLIILMLPLFFLSFNYAASFKNTLDNEVKWFADPGLLNSINRYQGEAREDGFYYLGRSADNKYLLFSEYGLLKYANQLIPSVYFTQQGKLLNFSFSPPITLGFLIPFIYGLYQVLQSSLLRKTFLVSTLLVIPSVLAKQAVDLNRLIIFAPVIILITSYGLMLMLKNKSDKRLYLFLIVSLSLIIFQQLFTVFDIQFKEKMRFEKYFEQNYELEK